MSEDGPQVHELLGKEDDEEEDSTRSAVSDEADEHYPEDVESETPDTGEDTDNDEGPDTDVMDAKSEEEADEKTLTEKLSLHHKCGTEKEFTQLGKRDIVLFDTPVEGLKTGKITDRTESWSGILQVEVDTGAKSYTITPFQDDYSAEYVATVDSKMELSQAVLDTLEAASIDDISTGESVILDVPKMGPTRTTVTDVVESQNQGKRATFKAAQDLHFVVYEEPSGTQTKEQSYIVGRERNDV
jgi:hypothetical protein